VTTLADFRRNHPAFFTSGNIQGWPEKYNVKTVNGVTYLLVTKFLPSKPDEQETAIWVERQGYLHSPLQKFTSKGSIKQAKDWLKENK